MTNRSIMNKRNMNVLMHSAKRALTDDASIVSRVVILTAADLVCNAILKLSDFTENKARYWASAGRRLREYGHQPFEAVLICKSEWIKDVQDIPAATKVTLGWLPQDHEAIVAIGRSADNHRLSQVIQPYKWDKVNSLVWLPSPLATYNTARGIGDRFIPILDYLLEQVSTVPL